MPYGVWALTASSWPWTGCSRIQKSQQCLQQQLGMLQVLAGLPTLLLQQLLRQTGRIRSSRGRCWRPCLLWACRQTLSRSALSSRQHSSRRQASPVTSRLQQLSQAVQGPAPHTQDLNQQPQPQHLTQPPLLAQLLLLLLLVTLLR
jgi:hypothetical protein